MEKSDLELIDQFSQKDQELAVLWKEHQGFEHRLNKLERKPFLSPEEQEERNTLKKQKLAGRDQIESILAKYRQRVMVGANNS
jgi:uncharacterized protein